MKQFVSSNAAIIKGRGVPKTRPVSHQPRRPSRRCRGPSHAHPSRKGLSPAALKAWHSLFLYLYCLELLSARLERSHLIGHPELACVGCASRCAPTVVIGVCHLIQRKTHDVTYRGIRIKTCSNLPRVKISAKSFDTSVAIVSSSKPSSWPIIMAVYIQEIRII